MTPLSCQSDGPDVRSIIRVELVADIAVRSSGACRWLHHA